VIRPGNDEHFKILVRIFQRVDELRHRDGINIMVKFSEHQQEFAL
jgi:hypothetical protein